MAPPAPEIDLARVLCRLADLPTDGCREFRADGVRAYVNRCAHLSFRLNYTPHGFLTTDGSMILCSMHGAIFEKDTGYCDGLSLIGLPIRIETGYVLLADEADPDELAARYA
jgi:nitrite reductase/ring-hydroxylating ferredoxin subunit